jgi:hypothetical protein
MRDDHCEEGLEMAVSSSRNRRAAVVAMSAVLFLSIFAASARESGVREAREKAPDRAQADARMAGPACPAGWSDMNAGGAGGPACVTDATAKALKSIGEMEACPRPFVRKCVQVKPNWTICWCEQQVPHE